MTKCAVLITAALALIHGASLPAATLPNGGTISIEIRTADGGYDPSTRSFADAAARVLATRGFTILDDPGHAAWVAGLILDHEEVGTARAKAPAGSADAIPGASAGVGIGVVIPFSTGKSDLVPVRRTRLELSIRRRGEEGVAWHGAAVTVRAAGTRKGGDEAVAADLSQALLQDYPAEPKDVVGVP